MRAARVGPLLGLLAAGVRAAPIRLHPDNPRYFLYEGRALALITATEHFGGIINLDFNFERYFKALGAHNFTLAQAWTGAYVEPDADVGPNNTLDPKLGRYIAPWARSSVPGNAKGGNKFDLTKFNQTFFERLERDPLYEEYQQTAEDGFLYLQPSLLARSPIHTLQTNEGAMQIHGQGFVYDLSIN